MGCVASTAAVVPITSSPARNALVNGSEVDANEATSGQSPGAEPTALESSPQSAKGRDVQDDDLEDGDTQAQSASTQQSAMGEEPPQAEAEELPQSEDEELPQSEDEEPPQADSTSTQQSAMGEKLLQAEDEESPQAESASTHQSAMGEEPPQTEAEEPPQAESVSTQQSANGLDVQEDNLDDEDAQAESLKAIHVGIISAGFTAPALGPPEVPPLEKFTPLASLPDCLTDLHEGMPPEVTQAPMRLLKISSVISSWTKLKVHEEVDVESEALELQYEETTDDLWRRVVTVSWRWAETKPAELQPGFSPMAEEQFKELKALLRVAEEHKIEYFWIDWSCVPQYSQDAMVEVHRSKVFYARSRAMLVLPTFNPLPSGPVRLILVKTRRVLEQQAEGGSARCLVAAAVIGGILKKNIVAGRDYFGRVWTLAERMARYGRGEGLWQWLSLEAWLGMLVDAMLKSTEDRASSQIYKKMLGRSAARLLEKVLEPLDDVVSAASVRVPRAEGLEKKIADLCKAAVGVWLSPSRLQEAPTRTWLHTYLSEEATVGVYQAFSEPDRVWAIYSYYCWKSHLDRRSAEALAVALGDLVKVAGEDRRHYQAGMYTQLGIAVVSKLTPKAKEWLRCSGNVNKQRVATADGAYHQGNKNLLPELNAVCVTSWSLGKVGEKLTQRMEDQEAKGQTPRPQGNDQFDLYIHQPLGRGGFASCWRATLNGQDVALKVLAPRQTGVARIIDGKQQHVITQKQMEMYQRMFLREAEMTSRLRHSHIIECYGVIQLPEGSLPEQTSPALAMVLELCEPFTIRDLLTDSMCMGKRLIRVKQTYEWLLQIASALAHLHGQKEPIIHRDIKPENVLLGRRPTGELICKLSDLGLHAMVDRHRSVMLRASSNSLSLLRRGSGLLAGVSPSKDVSSGSSVAAELLSARSNAKHFAMTTCPDSPFNGAGGGDAGSGGGAPSGCNITSTGVTGVDEASRRRLTAALGTCGSESQTLRHNISRSHTPEECGSPFLKISGRLPCLTAGGAKSPRSLPRTGSMPTPLSLHWHSAGYPAMYRNAKLGGSSGGSAGYRALHQVESLAHAEPHTPQRSTGPHAAAAPGASGGTPSGSAPRPGPPHRFQGSTNGGGPPSASSATAANSAGARGARCSPPSAEETAVGSPGSSGRSGRGGLLPASFAPVDETMLACTHESFKLKPFGSVVAGAHPVSVAQQTEAEEEDLKTLSAKLQRHPGLVEQVPASSPAEGLRRVDSLLEQLGISELTPLRHHELEWVYGLTGKAGSLMYMAPEVLRNQPYNEKSDVFSFGVMAYELLSNQLLAMSIFNTVRAAKMGINHPHEYAGMVADGYRPPRFPCSDAAWALIELCWHPDPVQRPSMKEVVATLEALLASDLDIKQSSFSSSNRADQQAAAGAAGPASGAAGSKTGSMTLRDRSATAASSPEARSFAVLASVREQHEAAAACANVAGWQGGEDEGLAAADGACLPGCLRGCTIS